MPSSATEYPLDQTRIAEFLGPLQPADAERLDALAERLASGRDSLVGFPTNQTFDYSELFRFLQFAGNNVGDPFAAGGSGLDTHVFEREVIDEFTGMLGGKPADTWGYVTSGGTEGNLYGLHVASELHPDGIVYYSDQSHYSVAKSVRLMRGRSEVIATQSHGEMNYADFSQKLEQHLDRPAIVVVNIGTTIQSAIDDVEQIRAVLSEVGVQEVYLHCDAALSGLILPFVANAPAFDFAAGVDSIAISGHKLIGAPLPCGVVLTKRKHAEQNSQCVPYLGTVDATISGSRSAFGPLMLWYALRRLGHDGLQQMVDRCFALADYAIDKFRAHGVHAWRNPHSITVVLPRPTDAVLRRWQMATHDDIAQLVTLPHVSEEVIDRVAEDYEVQ
jgi:histidine decarboxylase